MCMPVPDPTQVINYGLSDGGRSRGGLSSEWAEDYGCSMCPMILIRTRVICVHVSRHRFDSCVLGTWGDRFALSVVCCRPCSFVCLRAFVLSSSPSSTPWLALIDMSHPHSDHDSDALLRHNFLFVRAPDQRTGCLIGCF